MDVGSNSVLLAVAELREGRWKPVFESAQVTGLGTGARQSGLLQAEPMNRTLEALRGAFEKAAHHGAESTLAAATMALRIATNADEFLGAARSQGTPITVISGEEEARLGFESVAADLRWAGDRRITILDPGGHSTEIVTSERKGAGWSQKFESSFAVGALGLLEGPLEAESPDAAALVRASTEIDECLNARLHELPAGRIVSLGATPVNLARIELGLTEWDPEAIHGFELGLATISGYVQKLSDLSLEQRRGLRGIEPGREATLPGGALILERCLHYLRAETCSVSVRGWRHAMIEQESWWRPGELTGGVQKNAQQFDSA